MENLRWVGPDTPPGMKFDPVIFVKCGIVLSAYSSSHDGDTGFGHVTFYT